MTILSNKKQPQQQQQQASSSNATADSNNSSQQQQQSTSSPCNTDSITNAATVIGSSGPSTVVSNKQRLIHIVNDNINEENVNSLINNNNNPQSSPLQPTSSILNNTNKTTTTNNKLNLSSQPSSPSSSPSSSSSSSPLSSVTTSPEFKINPVTLAPSAASLSATDRSENTNINMFAEPLAVSSTLHDQLCAQQQTLSNTGQELHIDPENNKNNNTNTNEQTPLECSIHLRKPNRNKKNNKRKIRTNHNIPMPLPPPHQRQRNSASGTPTVLKPATTAISHPPSDLVVTPQTKDESIAELNYSSTSGVAAAVIGSLSSLNNSCDEQRLLNDSNDDEDSDFDNSDFDLSLNRTQNDTSSDRDDFSDENYMHHHHQHQHHHQQLHFSQPFSFINNHHHHLHLLHNHHTQQQQQQQQQLHHTHTHHHHHQQQQQHHHSNRISLEQENELPVLNTLHRNTSTTNTSNKPVKTKKKSKKNTNLFNNNSNSINNSSNNNNNNGNGNTNNKSKRNSVKENLKKENDYLNNNSEDEYENRPIMIRNLSGLGNYNNTNNTNNQILNGMSNEKSLFNVETIEELETKFCQLLKEKKGFIIRPMKEDGACLFRAVADQIFGDEEMHSTIRSHCMDYIAKNADYFKQYMTEDVDRYISRKRQDNCHGNHIEIIAIAEIYNRPIEVYEYSLEPKNSFQGVFQTDNEPIRLSYHGRNHYNSVVDPFKATIGVGLGLPQMTPGLAEKNLMNEALKKSEEFHLEQTMLDDKLKATDWEATNEEIMELVARESYLQWLKDNEKRSMDRNALNLYCDQMPSTNAQCSTWDTNSSDLMGRNANHQHLSQQNQNSNHRLSLNRRTSTSTPPRSPSQSKLSHFKSSPPSQNPHQQQQQHHQLKSNRNDELNYFDDKSRSANKTKSTSSTSPAATTIANTKPFTANVSSSNMTSSTSLPTTSNKTDSIDSNNLLMYDENAMQYQYYETKNIMNELTPDLFGLNSNDWIGLDSGNGNDSDILAQVLAASQAEYLESLKAKRQQQK